MKLKLFIYFILIAPAICQADFAEMNNRYNCSIYVENSQNERTGITVASVGYDAKDAVTAVRAALLSGIYKTVSSKFGPELSTYKPSGGIVKYLQAMVRTKIFCSN